MAKELVDTDAWLLEVARAVIRQAMYEEDDEVAQVKVLVLMRMAYRRGRTDVHLEQITARVAQDIRMRRSLDAFKAAVERAVNASLDGILSAYSWLTDARSKGLIAGVSGPPPEEYKTAEQLAREAIRKV